MMGWLLLACASGTPDSKSESTDAPTFTEIHAALFPPDTAAKCDFCHSQPPSQVSNGLLNTGTDDRDAAYAALIDHTSTSRDCAGQPFIVPGDAESSLFFVKLTSDPGCGERMPLGNGALPADQRLMVKSWIDAGAKDD